MAIAQGSLSRLTYVAESAWGTTPNTPTMKTLRTTGHTLEVTRASLLSAELSSDRNIRTFRLGAKQATGDINGELSVGTYDDLIEAALGGAWNTDVCKIGTSLKSFSIEAGHTDIAQYLLYSGMMVNQMALSFRPNAMATVRFGMLGKTVAISATSVDVDPTAASTTQALAAWDGTIQEGGSSIAIVTSLDILLDNGVTVGAVLGTPDPPQAFNGRGHVNGTMSAYFQDAALLTKFVNETESSLQVQVADGTKSLTFKLGSIKYTRAGAPVTNEQGISINMPFEAYYNSGDASTIVVTRDLT